MLQGVRRVVESRGVSPLSKNKIPGQVLAAVLVLCRYPSYRSALQYCLHFVRRDGIKPRAELRWGLRCAVIRGAVHRRLI